MPVLDLGEQIIHKIQVTVVIEPDEEGFHGYAPGLKGLHVDGKTRAETLRHAEEAIDVYLRSIISHGEPLPVGPDLTVKRELIPAVPEGAFLHSVTVQWHCPNMSGRR
jgi:predicted RNase H-like HicB family nuclease